jgi:hypothetical protein
MITPREAIQTGQVWLRPFGHFMPGEQGYMGFASPEVRDRFLDQIVDGALVIIWTRQADGEPGWVGKFRGILQLERTRGTANDFSSAVGMALSKKSGSDFSHAVKAKRAWVADPGKEALMKNITPSIWPEKTQSIGHYSGQMDPSELVNLERRRIKEVDVFGQPSVGPSTFDEIRKLFT